MDWGGRCCRFRYWFSTNLNVDSSLAINWSITIHKPKYNIQLHQLDNNQFRVIDLWFMFIFLDTKYHVFYIWHMNVTCHPWTPAFVARHRTEVHWATKSSNVAALEAMTRGNRGLLSTVTHCMFKKKGWEELSRKRLSDWWWLDHDFFCFSVYREFHSPNWLSSNIFQRGRSTTNQIYYQPSLIIYINHMLTITVCELESHLF
jgi:hypothetical protein